MPIEADGVVSAALTSGKASALPKTFSFSSAVRMLCSRSVMMEGSMRAAASATTSATIRLTVSGQRTSEDGRSERMLVAGLRDGEARRMGEELLCGRRDVVLWRLVEVRDGLGHAADLE